MKRYRLDNLPAGPGGHIFRGTVAGEFITEGAMDRRQPGEVVPPAVHDDEEIFVILQGRATVHFDQGVEALTPGDVLVVEPGERHSLEADGEDPCVQLYLHFGPKAHWR